MKQLATLLRSRRGGSLFAGGSIGEGIVQGFVQELKVDIGHSHVLTTESMQQLKRLFIKDSGFTLDNVGKALMGALTAAANVFNWFDIAIITFLIVTYKPFLRKLYSLAYNEKAREHSSYEKSLFGVLERPVSYSVFMLPAMYAIDVFTVLLASELAARLSRIHTCEPNPHSDIGTGMKLKYNLGRVVSTSLSCYISGTYATRVKDWLLHVVQDKTPPIPVPAPDAPAEKYEKLRAAALNRERVRHRTVNELTSMLVWGIMLGVYLEAMSLQLGFALGSILTFGSIGSASAILALRGTTENLVGGVLLKLQDKFHVGEVVTVPKMEQGVVEEMAYTTVSLRRADNSVVIVPNSIFTSGEVVNWSRTPYRLFKSSVAISITELSNLPGIINSIRANLAAVKGIETDQRDLLVSASGFKDGKIIVDIEAHFMNEYGDEELLSAMKTEAVEAIARAIAGAQLK